MFEAIRRPRVVSVSIPLRRVTLLALTMSVPALLLHREAEHLKEALNVSQWTWFLIAAVIIFVIGQLHHGAVELADRYFNRDIDKAERDLGEAILTAKDPAQIDHLLSERTRGHAEADLGNHIPPRRHRLSPLRKCCWLGRHRDARSPASRSGYRGAVQGLSRYDP